MNDSTSDTTDNFSFIERISAGEGQLFDYYTEIFNYSRVHACYHFPCNALIDFPLLISISACCKISALLGDLRV